MPAEISIERLPEARARLAAMPRGEVEAVVLRALVDAAMFCAGASELQLAIVEAGDYLRNGDHDLAQARLEDVLAANVKATASVPMAGVAP